MKQDLYCSKILIKKSHIHGYGVFADQDFVENDMIEEAFALRTHGNEAALHDYYFSGDEEYYVVSLGYGSLYNHSSEANAQWNFDSEHSILTFKANRPIKKGEEIFISYGNNWFSGRNMPMKSISFWYKHRKFFSSLIKFSLVVSVILSVLFLSRVMMMIMVKLF